jgi:hypothetical protein
MSSLKVRYDPDPDDDVGQLWLSVTTDRFSGTGFFWSYREGVRELADKLCEYPLPNAATATWGYDDIKGDNVILNIQVAPVNMKGDLVAEVQIADLYDQGQRVIAAFSTTYAEVDVFRQQLTALANGRADDAELSGS